MGPVEINEIRIAFSLSPRELASALNVAPLTVARWEEGRSAPTGLQEEVLQALHSTALNVIHRGDWEQTRHLRGLVMLGIGALIYYLLSQQAERPPSAVQTSLWDQPSPPET